MRLHATLFVLAALAVASPAFIKRSATPTDPDAVRKFVDETIRLSRASAPRSDPLARSVDELPTTSRHGGASHSHSRPMQKGAMAAEQVAEEQSAMGSKPKRMASDDDDDHDDDHDDDDDDDKDDKQCESTTPFDRVVTLAASFNTSEDAYELVDSDDIFLKVGAGLSNAEIDEQREETLSFFSKQFGVPRQNFTFPKTFTRDDEPSNGTMAFYSVVLSQRNNIVADSKSAVPCGNVYALWGGFTAVARNITLGGEFSGGLPVYYAGTVTLFNFVMVLAPGTEGVRRVLFRGIRPLACDFTGCTLSAITFMFEDGVLGDADGSIQVEPPMVHTRVALTWPSRFASMTS